LSIFVSAIFLDLSLLGVEYIIKKDKKVTPKLWLFNNILVDAGLSFMMLDFSSLVSIIIASICIISVVSIDGYIMMKEYDELKKIKNVRLNPDQFFLTIDAVNNIHKDQSSARSKTIDIYFNDKCLE